MKKWLASGVHLSSLDSNLALLVFRVYIGLTMAFAHGLGKLPPNSQFTGYLASLGLPMPELMSWMAGLSEFGGGLLVALGIATRWSALTVVGAMAVAAFMAHGADPFAKKELALAYFASFGVLAFLGAGRFSVDRLIRQ